MGKKRKLIKIKKESEFQSYLSKGYKVVNNFNRFGFTNDGKGNVVPDYNYGYIFLEKGDEQLIVNCSELGVLFASQYSQVADIDGAFFDKVSNQTEKLDIEGYTYNYFNDRRKPVVHVEKINSNKIEKIIQYIKGYVENEIAIYSRNNSGKNLFNIFSNVILITENNNEISCEICDKNHLTIKKIRYRSISL